MFRSTDGSDGLPGGILARLSGIARTGIAEPGFTSGCVIVMPVLVALVDGVVFGIGVAVGADTGQVGVEPVGRNEAAEVGVVTVTIVCWSILPAGRARESRLGMLVLRSQSPLHRSILSF